MQTLIVFQQREDIEFQSEAFGQFISVLLNWSVQERKKKTKKQGQTEPDAVAIFTYSIFNQVQSNNSNYYLFICFLSE